MGIAQELQGVVEKLLLLSRFRAFVRFEIRSLQRERLNLPRKSVVQMNFVYGTFFALVPVLYQYGARANTTFIASENLTLPNWSYTEITFVWNTTSLTIGNYTISAYAWPVQNETNIANYSLAGGTVCVSIPGDVNGDSTVNKLDAVILSSAFDATPSSSNWNGNADINDDGTVDIYDAILLAANYGKTVTTA
jgi:hypothetical protein